MARDRARARARTEAPLVRVEGAERGRTARVRYPGTGRDAPSDFRDRPVGNAEEHQLSVVVGHLQAAFEQAGADRGADAARADDVDLGQHKSSSSLADTGQASV